jgi:hypothetical protein
MRFFGVVPDKISHQILIEFLGFVKFIHIPKDRLILNGFVEPFHVFIHLRLSGVVKKMDDLLALNIFPKVFVELLAIIGLDTGY